MRSKTAAEKLTPRLNKVVNDVAIVTVLCPHRKAANALNGLP
jgi:hypothetical protein